MTIEKKTGKYKHVTFDMKESLWKLFIKWKKKKEKQDCIKMNYSQALNKAIHERIRKDFLGE